jgi:hypothetical protein
MYYNYEILITNKEFSESIEVLSDSAKILVITVKNLTDFFGEKYKNRIIFNCFLKSSLKNKQINQVFINFISVDKEIQNKIKKFYMEQEENTTKKRKRSVNNTQYTSKGVFEVVPASTDNNYNFNSVICKAKADLTNLDIVKSNSNYKRNSFSGGNNYKQYLDPENKNIEMKELFKLFKLKSYFPGEEIIIKKDKCVIVLDGIVEEVSFYI